MLDEKSSRLIDRIETAGPEQQRELLLEGFNAIFPKEGLGITEVAEREVRAVQFLEMLDAQAYVDAALMLVDDHWDYSLYRWDGGGDKPFQFQMETEEMRQKIDFDPISATTSTPALAILSACLKAGEGK